MGNWRNRSHRRFFYRRRSPKSPPSYSFDNEPSSSGFCNDGIPLWEKKFCTLIGKVPWKKIVYTQKFVYNDIVLKWDDAAGKEAFENAKERFWARINDFPCHISSPDPDIYIDEIDWNPSIDPELIRDLESVYFVHDDGEKDPKDCRRIKRLRYLASIHNKECNGNSGGKNMGVGSGNQCNGNSDLKNTRSDHNLLESSFTPGNDVVEDKTQGWKQLEDNGNNNDANNDDNPWERSCSQGNEALMKSTWADCGDKVWGWTRRVDHGNLFCDNGGNPWEQRYRGVDPVKDYKGWGDSGNNSQCWSQRKSWKWDRSDNPRSPNFSKYTRPAKDSGLRDSRDTTWNRGWRDDGGDSWGRKQWDNQDSEPKFERSSRNWGAQNSSCRKREGSHLSSYKSSRYQQDYNQSGQFWRSKNANKRVQFCT